MRIAKTTPTFTPRADIIVPQNLNKGRQYLYNEVLDLVNKHKKPAIFHNKWIEVSNVCENFKEALNQIGIKFVSKKS